MHILEREYRSMKIGLNWVLFLLLCSVVTIVSAATPGLPDKNQVYITETEKKEFLKAAEDGNLDKVKEMHQAMPQIIKVADKDEWTALLYAARFGRLKVVEYLLQNGAKIDEMDVDRYTALHHAAAFGHKKTCEFLVKKGAKINARTKGAVTPRRLAESNGHAGTADYLEDKGGVR